MPSVSFFILSILTIPSLTCTWQLNSLLNSLPIKLTLVTTSLEAKSTTVSIVPFFKADVVIIRKFLWSLQLNVLSVIMWKEVISKSNP